MTSSQVRVNYFRGHQDVKKARVLDNPGIGSASSMMCCQGDTGGPRLDSGWQYDISFNLDPISDWNG